MSSYPSLSQADALAIAERHLLSPSDMGREALDGALEQLLGNGADYADLYFQAGQSESWSLERGKVATGGFSIMQGVGARAVSGEQTAFAYSSAMTPRAVATATASVRSMLLHGDDAARNGGAQVEGDPRRPLLYTVDNPLEAMAAVDKIALLQEVDRRCREADPRVVQVSAQLQVSHTSILVAGSDGGIAGDVRPLVQLVVTVVAESGLTRAMGNGVEGGRLTVVDLYGERLDRAVRTAVNIALVNLDARPAPSGVMSVVLGNGFPGVLLH